MSTTKLKASDRQALFRKIATVLKKEYGGSVPKDQRNVLETMLFACCLEDARYADAEAAYKNLIETFHDLNEIRVSSISEVERSLESLDNAAWRALRVRDTLQYVFEKYYVFDFEPLRRKTMDAAVKQLAKIKCLSPFVQLYTLQHSLGAHVVPMDETLCEVIAWLGLIPQGLPPDKAAEEIKSSVRKPDAALLCHLLRELGADPKFKSAFKITKSMLIDGEVDASDAPERLRALIKNPPKRTKKVSKSRKKPASPKTGTATKRSKVAKKATATKKKVTKKVTRPKRTAKKKTTRSSVRKKK
ncbi:MAG: hypothetical protein KDA93_05750 [Planctomycetaceae bacterium]|nr:hypothetical protein [Planctomycetaceae bacterium]